MNIEQMSAIYKMAKAIYNKEERLVNGKEKLFLSHGINKNSFLVMVLTKTLSQIFIEHFKKCLMANCIQEG